jgi:transcriptional regulator with XRE-family HTH domain
MVSPKEGTGMTIGERIKTRRAKLGLSQYDVAGLAEVRRPTIAELETNKRMTVSSDILKRLARALQCSTDYLVGMYEEDDMTRPPRRRRMPAPTREEVGA